MLTIIAGGHNICMGKTVNRKHLGSKWRREYGRLNSMVEWVNAQLVDGPNLRLVASPAGIRAIAFEHSAHSSRPAPVNSRPAFSGLDRRNRLSHQGGCTTTGNWLAGNGESSGPAFSGLDRTPKAMVCPTGPVPLLVEAVRQLEAYFRGELREFQLPLDFEGTDFQKRVWRQLQTIPYGQTRSYSEIARAIGSPQAVRAVGAANGANPIAIVVPCHRVIGASGKLVGYGGGLPLKKRLLELEGVVTASLDGMAL
jgi:methylated-DNA-[protein]-cysteine S-methyltransferase